MGLNLESEGPLLYILVLGPHVLFFVVEILGVEFSRCLMIPVSPPVEPADECLRHLRHAA